MKIEILAVLEEPIKKVEFRSQWGSGVGSWMDDVLPRQGDIAHVEIDLPEESSEFRSCPLAKLSEPVFREVNGAMNIVGLVERIAEDGIIELRVGSDIIVLSDLPDRSIFIEGQCVEASNVSLALYPLNL